MAGTSRSEAPNPGEAEAGEDRDESIEILYEGLAAFAGGISPDDSIWEWSARRGAIPSFETVAMRLEGGLTGYGATLRLLGATAEGTGSSVREAKRNAELAMWEGLCRKGGRRRIRLLNQGGAAGGGQAEHLQQDQAGAGLRADAPAEQDQDARDDQRVRVAGQRTHVLLRLKMLKVQPQTRTDLEPVVRQSLELNGARDVATRRNAPSRSRRRLTPQAESVGRRRISRR